MTMTGLTRKQSLRQAMTASLATSAVGLMAANTASSAASGGGGASSMLDGNMAGMSSAVGALSGTGLGLEIEECIRARVQWWETSNTRLFMRFCAFLSLMSVSMNTSHTYKRAEWLIYVTFVLDCLVAFIFFIEFVSKIKFRGCSDYFQDRWSQFDFFMLLCILLSLSLHVFEMLGKLVGECALSWL